MGSGELLSTVDKESAPLYTVGRKLQAQSVIGERGRMLIRVEKRTRAIGKRGVGWICEG